MVFEYLKQVAIDTRDFFRWGHEGTGVTACYDEPLFLSVDAIAHIGMRREGLLAINFIDPYSRFNSAYKGFSKQVPDDYRGIARDVITDNVFGSYFDFNIDYNMNEGNIVGSRVRVDFKRLKKNAVEVSPVFLDMDASRLAIQNMSSCEVIAVNISNGEATDTQKASIQPIYRKSTFNIPKYQHIKKLDRNQIEADRFSQLSTIEIESQLGDETYVILNRKGEDVNIHDESSQLDPTKRNLHILKVVTTSEGTYIEDGPEISDNTRNTLLESVTNFHPQ